VKDTFWRQNYNREKELGFQEALGLNFNSSNNLQLVFWLWANLIPLRYRFLIYKIEIIHLFVEKTMKKYRKLSW
jgi:hypothetical protein